MQIIIDKDGNKQKKDAVKRSFKKSRYLIKPGRSEPGAVHPDESKNYQPVQINNEHRDKKFRHNQQPEPSRLHPELKEKYEGKIDCKEIN